MLLVKFDDNWADEMDVSGFKLFDNLDDWNEAIKDFEDELKADRGYEKDELLGEFEIYFGTNEEIAYTSMEDFLKHFKVILITEDQKFAIESIFPEATSDYGYGHFPI